GRLHPGAGADPGVPGAVDGAADRLRPRRRPARCTRRIRTRPARPRPLGRADRHPVRGLRPGRRADGARPGRFTAHPTGLHRRPAGDRRAGHRLGHPDGDPGLDPPPPRCRPRPGGSVTTPAPAATGPLHVQGLSKSYADLRALTDVTFSVAPGEIFGFVGSNGAGKTTTMRIVLGVLAADAGRVTV